MEPENDRREHIRFDPESNSLCVLESFGNNDSSVIGLLRDRSKSGCAAVFHEQDFDYTEGDSLDLQAGSKRFIESELIWAERLDEKFIKAGFEFRE